jgi:hypothetical protein
MTEKRICGILHVQKACRKCRGLFWVAKKYARQTIYCLDCHPAVVPHLSDFGNRAPLTPRSDMQYHGEH